MAYTQDLIRDFCDWFSQDFDLISSSMDEAIRGYIAQHGRERGAEVLRVLRGVEADLGVGPTMVDCLVRHGWEWAFNDDISGESWLPELLNKLETSVQSN